MRQWLIAALALMVACGYAVAAEATPLPAPSAGFLLPDQQIIGLRLTHPPATSLHQFAKTSLAMARQVMVDPQLFAIQMQFNASFREHEASNLPLMLEFAYSTAENLTQYLETAGPFFSRESSEAVTLELAPFIRPKRNCLGVQKGGLPEYWREPPQPEDEHPALKNWKVDLPEVWKIIKEDRDFATAEILRFQISSAAWLRQGDRIREKACDWTVYGSEDEHSQRLLNESGDRAVAVIETERPNRTWTTPKCFGNGFEGRYLIADAATGDKIEKGNYFHCEADDE